MIKISLIINLSKTKKFIKIYKIYPLYIIILHFMEGILFNRFNSKSSNGVISVDDLK